MDSVRRTEGTRARSETVLNTVQARQGVTGHNVRYVLAFGLAGVVLAFLITWLADTGAFGAL